MSRFTIQRDHSHNGETVQGTDRRAHNRGYTYGTAEGKGGNLVAWKPCAAYMAMNGRYMRMPGYGRSKVVSMDGLCAHLLRGGLPRSVVCHNERQARNFVIDLVNAEVVSMIKVGTIEYIIQSEWLTVK